MYMRQLSKFIIQIQLPMQPVITNDDANEAQKCSSKAIATATATF